MVFTPSQVVKWHKLLSIWYLLGGFNYRYTWSYDDQISNLKTALSDVQKDLKKSTEAAEQFALRLDGRINALDSSVKDSLTQLSQSFADSLNKAMARQDNQMTTNFNDLKALLEASAAVPSPAKKHMRMDDL